jgi:hypothetical protein
MLKRLLKILHEISAVGVMGSFAACLVLVLKGPTQPLVAYAAVGRPSPQLHNGCCCVQLSLKIP